MNLFSREEPKIKSQSNNKAEGFNGWIKCTDCAEMIHESELEKNLQCCPKCGCHYRLTGLQRVALLADEGSFKELFTHFKPTDPLEFMDTESYKKRIASAQKKSGRDEGAIVGSCRIHGRAVALGVMDFSFMAGSMGSVVGERLTSIIEYGMENSLPVVIVSASGGARMQESVLSLMQMAKTSAALAKLHEKGIPFISILTNPTSGGVTASFASLGDVIIAEPNALICFAGPRVVEQVIKQKLPEGAQRSEFLLDKGMVDCIVSRSQLKGKISLFLDYMMDNDRIFESWPQDADEKKASAKLKKLLNASTKEDATT